MNNNPYDRTEVKIGMILQSVNASEKEIEAAYDFMEEKDDNRISFRKENSL